MSLGSSLRHHGAALWSTTKSALDMTATVTRKVRVADGQGGFTTSGVPTVVGSWPARLRPLGTRDLLQGGRLVTDVTHLVTLDRVAADLVRRDDTIQIGSVVMKVVGLREPREVGDRLELDCRQEQEAP